MAVLVYVQRVWVVVSSVGVWCTVYRVRMEIRVRIVKRVRRVLIFEGFFILCALCFIFILRVFLSKMFYSFLVVVWV